MDERGNGVPTPAGTADFSFLCFVEIGSVVYVGLPGTHSSVCLYSVAMLRGKIYPIN